jgi:hypothetical protein
MEARSSKWLKADPELVRMYREKLESIGDGPYIGVSWKGGLSKTHAHLRSSTKADWERIVQHGTVVSLQYGDAQQYADDLGIPHWPEAIADLDHFAALIMALDLVVSVCNTTIHVSGALGIPTWIMVPSKPAWRYGLTGDRMPWYPEARMFRQIGNDWSSVYSTVEKRLAAYATDYAGISADERREARI